MSSFFY